MQCFVVVDRSLFGYSLMYRVHLRPWEIDPDPPELTAWLESRQGPPGRALDLGCGTGRQTLLLARRGWRVVGIDFVPAAIEQARRRLDRAGAEGRLIVGDVRQLGELDLGDRFDLVLDLKCLHGLPPRDRLRYAGGVASACQSRGWCLLFGLTPNRMRGLLGAPGGVSRAEVERLFDPDFEFVDVNEARGGTFTPSVYQMRRRGRPSGI
jgi:SAM-dependent methyltransferase